MQGKSSRTSGGQLLQFSKARFLLGDVSFLRVNPSLKLMRMVQKCAYLLNEKGLSPEYHISSLSTVPWRTVPDKSGLVLCLALNAIIGVYYKNATKS